MTLNFSGRHYPSDIIMQAGASLLPGLQTQLL